MKLDSDQEKIVNSKDSNILVVAGAGSGKTRVLTERVGHLIELGVNPCNIVCITFTNIAAQEMKSRLSDVRGIGDSFIGTIHGFANSIYKDSGISYSILNSEIALRIYSQIIRDKRQYKNLSNQSLSEYFNKVKLYERGKILKEEVDRFFMPSERNDFEKAEKELKKICKRRNIVTFDELLTKTQDYYNSINGKIEYLLVDELQDIDSLEYSFIKALNATNNFFVGDDWQAIYGFKGGDVNIFKSLIDDNNYAKFFLNNNYRNAKEIVEMGNVIINQVEDIIEKDILVKNNTDKGSVSTFSKANLGDCLEDIKMHKQYKDWFILVRSNKDALEVSVQLDEREMPYLTFKKAGMSFSQMQKLMSIDAIKLLTVHSAKGLENKNVILYGNFPIKKPSYIKDEEERKVMYVGVTRAKERLIILN